MPTGKSNRRRAAIHSFAAVALACVAIPGTALASSGRPSDGDLSSRLAELAKPSVRSDTPRDQAEALSVPAEGPGSLLRDGNRVLVEVRFAGGATAGVDDLRAVGAEVIDVSRLYQIITIAVKPSELTRLSSVPRVTAATEVLTPIAAASTCPSGVAVSEGDAQLRAAEARSTFGVDGSGVEVGILSDSFNQDGSAETSAADDVESGDLPGASNTCTGQSTPIDVLEDFVDPEAADEGRAMAQIVHDLAPSASLSFATAFTGMTAFAGNIEDLAAAGADVIVDDVSYFEEPFFQEGPVGVAVSNVTAAGVSYFSSAGNNNLIDGGKDIASWEAPAFRDASPTSCPAGVPVYAQHCMDFDPGAGVDTGFGITVTSGATLTVDLQWAQPWNDVTTDLDAYLLQAGTLVAPAIGQEVHNVTTQRPVEVLSWTNSEPTSQTIQLAFSRCDLVCDGNDGGDIGTPRVKFALLQNGGGVTSTEYESSDGGDVVGPTIFGHNGGEHTISLGAIRYTTKASPESFSSRGPVTNYFAPTESASPAPALGSPQILAKPDVVATDGGANTFFGSSVLGVWRFFGTSAAAPHAAAVAALMLQRNPTTPPAQIRAGLASTAAPVGAFGPSAVGSGLIDAVDAVASIVPPPAQIPGGTVAAPAEEEPRPPRTFIRRRPSKVVRTRRRTAKVVFRFGADEADVTFLCKFDRAVFRVCRRKIVWQAELGRHVLRVKARDSDSNVDPTPAVFRFRVEPVG